METTWNYKVSVAIGYTVGIVRYWPAALWSIARYFGFCLKWTTRDAFTRARKKARIIKALRGVLPPSNPERN